MLRIDSDQGRIGEIWWFNSDPRPVEMPLTLTIAGNDTGLKVNRKMVRWGTFGIGRHVQVRMEEFPHGQ